MPEDMPPPAAVQEPTRVEQWAIYVSPADAPGKFVARRWVMSGGLAQPADKHECDTLNAARILVEDESPLCTYVMPRQLDDDAPLVEVWL